MRPSTNAGPWWTQKRASVALGATHVRTDDDGHDYFAVMHDPEGNEFCVG